MNFFLLCKQSKWHLQWRVCNVAIAVRMLLFFLLFLSLSLFSSSLLRPKHHTNKRQLNNKKNRHQQQGLSSNFTLSTLCIASYAGWRTSTSLAVFVYGSSQSCFLSLLLSPNDQWSVRWQFVLTSPFLYSRGVFFFFFPFSCNTMYACDRRQSLLLASFFRCNCNRCKLFFITAAIYCLICCSHVASARCVLVRIRNRIRRLLPAVSGRETFLCKQPAAAFYKWTSLMVKLIL